MHLPPAEKILDVIACSIPHFKSRQSKLVLSKDLEVCENMLVHFRINYMRYNTLSYKRVGLNE